MYSNPLKGLLKNMSVPSKKTATVIGIMIQPQFSIGFSMSMRDRNSDRQRARTKDRQSLCPGWGAWGLPGLRCERGLAVGQVKGVLSPWGVANPQMQRCGSEREYDSRFQELKVVTITPACPHMNHALLCLPYLLSSSHLKVAD